MLFGFLLLAMTLGTQEAHLIWNGQALAILIWCLYRGRYQLQEVLTQVRLINNDQWDIKS
ncbi:hypothetical protein M595_4824 [Lyngbya aestuarii BL J]|uniref:Uncharacterized protein n=2 Tax=Lyngbya aestuarii TaxID=118322 RepID=U7QBG0_9CYAN|nr:hypothetical protein M595_4824 [Lyngbya aestuarii BL J]